MNKDYFAQKSKTYESDIKRVSNVKNIANAICEKINFNKNETILDFGSGTGLLSEEISLHVKKIITNDISNSMNEALKEKIKNNKFACRIETTNTNLCHENFPHPQVDGIISSMTIHHIEDIPSLFKTFFKMLKHDGFIAIADLETEDGTFHTKDTGVFHFGFDKDKFLAYAKKAGFINLEIKTVSIAKKSQGTYPIFLLTGRKPSLSS